MSTIFVHADAERLVLAYLLRDPHHYLEYSNSLKREQFAIRENNYLFRAIRQCCDEKLDLSIHTIYSLLEKTQTDESKGPRAKNKELVSEIINQEYIFDIKAIICDEASFKVALARIEEANIKRQIISEAELLKNQIIDNPSLTQVEAIEKAIHLSNFSKNNNFENINKQSLSEVLEELEVYIQEHANQGLTGLNTGYSRLNDETDGFHNGELIILAARTAVGKSALGLNMAYNIMQDNKKILFFSLEMSNHEIGIRLASLIAEIPNFKLRKSELGLMRPRYSKAKEQAKKYPIEFIDKSNIKPSEILNICRYKKEHEGLDFVVIDYLNLISPEDEYKGANRQEKVSSISRALKQTARELNIPVMAITQIKRNSSGNEAPRPATRGSNVVDADIEGPNLDDLRESGALEQDADLVLILFQLKADEENQGKEGKQTKYLKVAKNRHGKADFKIKLAFTGQFYLFEQFVDEEGNN